MELKAIEKVAAIENLRKLSIVARERERERERESCSQCRQVFLFLLNTSHAGAHSNKLIG